MYLDIGSNILIGRKEIITAVSIPDRFFTDFKKDDLDHTENVEFVNGDESIIIKSIIITNRGVYRPNISDNYLTSSFMEEI